MKHTMALASQFSHCYKEGLAKKDQEMMQDEYLAQEELKNEEAKANKSTKVSDNLKFGRNRANIAKLF